MKAFTRSPRSPASVSASALFALGLIVGGATHLSNAHASSSVRSGASPVAAHFQSPYGITLDSGGNVYVVDAGAFKVIKLSPAGKVLARWGKQGHGPGEFDQPEYIAVDRRGRVYVSDHGDDRVERFSPTGNFLGQWGKKGADTLSTVHGVAVGQDGNIYISALAGIIKYTPGGKHLATYDVPNTGPIHGVALDHAGNIYSSDWFGHITKLSPHGQTIVQWHNEKKGLGGTDLAEGVAVDAHGNVYVADYGFNRVDMFSAQLKPKGLFGKGSGGAPGQVSSPFGIAVGADGDIYIADSGNSRVQKLSSGGKVLAIWT